MTDSIDLLAPEGRRLLARMFRSAAEGRSWDDIQNDIRADLHQILGQDPKPDEDEDRDDGDPHDDTYATHEPSW